MIDELSLGLAPTIVEQLLPLVRDIAAQGTTVILVEQSVNLALTIAETAYFMEKGEIRFHGPTAELLERPDVLRSVFLEGAQAHDRARDRHAAGSHRDVGRHRRVEAPQHERSRPATRRRRRRGRRTDAIRAVARRRDQALRRARRALATFRSRATGGEIVGFIGPERRGQDHALRHDLRASRAPTRARSSPARATTRCDVTSCRRHVRARLGLGRSFQDGRLFPSLTVRRDDRARVRAAPRGAATRSAPRCTCRSSPTPKPTRRERVEELLELLGITDFRDKLGRELSTGSRRIVDLACVLAHDPSVLLLDEPSSGIAQREAEALGPLLLRIREQTGATLLVIEHDVPLLLSDRRPADRARPRRDRRRRTARRRRAATRRRAVVPRHHRSRDRTQRRARARLTPHRRNQGEHDGHTADSASAAVAARALRARSSRSSWSSRSSPWSSRSSAAATTTRTSTTTTTRRPPRKQTFADVPVLYNEAKAAGTLDKYTWQTNCDTTTGRVKIPILNPPPCVPVSNGDNGGATSPGVTADTIKIGYYIAEARPASTTRSSRPRARTTRPTTVGAGVQGLRRHLRDISTSCTAARSSSSRSRAPAASTDEVAAKADADKAAAAGVFAVHRRARAGAELPDRARAQEDPVHRHVHDRRSPQKSYVEQHSPYIWPYGPDARTDRADDHRAHQEAARRQARRCTPATPREAASRARSRCSATTRPTASTRRRGTTSTTT